MFLLIFIDGYLTKFQEEPCSYFFKKIGRKLTVSCFLNCLKTAKGMHAGQTTRKRLGATEKIALVFVNHASKCLFHFCLFLKEAECSTEFPNVLSWTDFQMCRIRWTEYKINNTRVTKFLRKIKWYNNILFICIIIIYEENPLCQ